MFISIGWTPLVYAASEGHLSIVEFLVTQDADVNVKNKYGKFLILCFIVKRQLVSYLLLKYTYNIYAARDGHFDIANIKIKLL